MDAETLTPPEPVKPMSFIDTLTNIFAAPGDLYENVRLTPKRTGNWTIPAILLIVVSLILSQLTITNPSLGDQMNQLVKKQMEKSVTEGKMTQEQADQTFEAFAKPSSTMATVIRVVATAVGIPIVLFVVAVFYWLVGKLGMHATAPYMKVVEVVGLTFYIGIVQGLVTTIMMFMMNSLFASPSLALAVSDFDIDNKLHLVLAQVNVFSIWSLVVTSIGLSKLFQRDLPKVLVLVFALWILWSAFSILTGIRLG